MKPTGIHVVPIGQVASFLGWPISRVRRASFLAPLRSAKGMRLYDVERVLALARTEAEFAAHVEARERRECRNLQRWARGLRRWLRGSEATDEHVHAQQRLRTISRCAAIALSYRRAFRQGFDPVVAAYGLRCALALIGSASTGLTADARTRHSQIPWSRVRALEALHEDEDEKLLRNGAEVLVPRLRRARLTAST